jgi:hypothetical protein
VIYCLKTYSKSPVDLDFVAYSSSKHVHSRVPRDRDVSALSVCGGCEMHVGILVLLISILFSTEYKEHPIMQVGTF